MLKALGISLLIHSLIGGGWKWGNKFGWMKWIPLVRALNYAESQLVSKTDTKESPTKDIPITQELAFLEVDPFKESELTPPNALYQSHISTEAANPTTRDLAAPKVEGEERDFPKVVENTRNLVPNSSSAKPAETDETLEELKPRPKEQKELGDMAKAKPNDKATADTGKAESKEGDAEREEKKRPRTLAQAQFGSYGEKTKQEGGVRKYDISASLAARGTLLGDYDAQLIDAVRQKWYSILDRVRATQGGKVVVEFTLHHDGRITNVKVIETTVSDLQSLYCEMAISEPAPYKKWPMELRRELKGDIREVRFTFYYE